MRKDNKPILFFLVVVIILVFVLYFVSKINKPDDTTPEAAFEVTGNLSVHFIDVGQGDSILISCDDEYMLIDAGDNTCGTLVQNYLTKQGIDKLKYVIGTHPDADHIGGLDVIITKFDCDSVFMPDYPKDTATYRDVIDAISYKNLTVTYPVISNEYSLGDATFKIIGPLAAYDDANNNSIVIRLDYGDNSFLFMGDAEYEAEQALLKSGANLDCDVIKLGHHGSSSSSSEAFLDAVSPDACIISCGENNQYGHPHQETLNSIRKRNIAMYRTDCDGTIIATSDGKSITFNVPASEQWS